MDIKIPEIRFKGVSGEWKVKTIAELIDDELIYPPKDGNHGNIHPKATDYVKYGIPFLMANNIRGGKIQFCDCYHISLEQAETLQKGFARTGDVLLTHKGTVGEVAVVPQTEFPYLMLTPQVTYYRISGALGLDTYFLATSFVTNSFQAPLKQEAGGGTRAYLGITAQQKLSISIPPKFEEQTKIGSYFQKLDSLIKQHQQKHDKLSNLKKAMLEKMFPKQREAIPEIRFKEFSREWGAKKLRSVASFHKGKGLPKSSIQGDGIYSCIHYGELFTKYSEVIEMTMSRTNQNDNFFSVSNDVLMPTSDVTPKGLVKPCCIKQNGVVLGGDILVIRPNNQNFIDGAFLSRFIRTREQQVLQNVTGSTVFHLYASSIENLDIAFPSIEEQTAIGNYFQKLDTLINQHQQQITKLTNIKQACLSKMFV